MLLGSLSRHNNDLERRTLKPSARHSSGSWTDCVIALRSQTDRVIALRQISVTALFYLEDSRRIHPQRREESGGVCQCMHGLGGGGREREREKECTHAGERAGEGEGERKSTHTR